jgi:MoxR-like ATPase
VHLLGTMPGMSQPLARSLTERLRLLRDAMLRGLVERDESIRLALLAALAGEHLLLLGDPGTAKSMVARRLHHAFMGGGYFERLLTRFTVPEELFGPLSIQGLEQDRYERLVAGYLPSATVAFLDEVFKANSAILNALLTLLNERLFDNGTSRMVTPLAAVVGASNELPKGEELSALYDRFLIRLQVAPVSKEGFLELLKLRGVAEPVIAQGLALSPQDLDAVRLGADQVDVPSDVEALLAELREWCAAEKLRVSDRRWRKIVKLLQVAAFTNGRSSVSIWDLWLLQHCLWDKPEDRTKVFDWYSERVGTQNAMNPSRLTQIVVSWEGQLQHDKKAQSQAQDEDGQLLFQAADGTPVLMAKATVQKQRNRNPLYLAPDNASQHSNYHFDSGRVRDRSNGGKGWTESELDEMYLLRSGGHHSFRHWTEREKYLGDSANHLMETAERPPLMEPTRHRNSYVNDVLREIDELRHDVGRYAESLDGHIQSLEQDIQYHLWVAADFAGPARANLEVTRRAVDELRDRVSRLRDGFASLPRERERGTQIATPARKSSKARSEEAGGE